MIALLALTLALPGTPELAPDSTEWSGFEIVEPRVVETLVERWGVDAADLRLEWGVVRNGWTPTDAVEVELQGTGGNGYWIVRLRENDQTLAIRLRAGTSQPTMVAARPLTRGAELQPEDVAWETRDSWGPPTGLSEVRPGWTVRRNVRLGEVLAPPLVTLPDAVRSGGPVTVEWVKGPVALTLPGTALGTVPVGGSVYVRTETGERLHGTAVAPGRVRVSPSR